MGKRRAELEVSAGGIVFRRPGGEPRGSSSSATPTTTGAFRRPPRERRIAGGGGHSRNAEETGLGHLRLQGPIKVIDWHFRFRGRHIHKYCHFFLFESSDGEASPQLDEGITACQWRGLGEALELLSYDNARGVLKRAGEMVQTLVAVGAGRSRPPRGAGRRGLSVAAIAAALESRPRCWRSAGRCRTAVPRVITCRTPAALRRVLERRLIDAIVITPNRVVAARARLAPAAPPRHPRRGLRSLPSR